MPDAQLSLVAPPHRNRQLFSDHYLDEVLPARAEWHHLRDEAARVLAGVRALFAAYQPTDNEAQLEQELVRPILALLGHHFEVQPALRVPSGTHHPDYALYRDADALAAGMGRRHGDRLAAEGGIAVADAKHWGRPLDTALQRAGTDPFSNRNPSYQIAFYLLHSGVEWGILTNGSLWRLYHRDTAHKLDHFYEVDLQELAAGNNPERFLYFYALFRRDAFTTGPLTAAEVLQASAEYARAVGDSLRDQVYEALLHVAQGFLDYAPNALETDAETLDRIRDNALILLYRLIFILYAEARELLPVRESDLYRSSYSLQAIKEETANALASGRPLLAGSALLWPRLKELFRIINLGDPPLKVATFNGGLFDPAKHPFLETYAVGDAHLQRAVDRLARVDGHFVDYRDLSVRHMGTIYEGLLEYHLVPAGPPSPPDLGGVGGAWRVALVNDKGERKATGSYYTPDYIVKYIVEQTVGPVLREAVAGKKSDAAKTEAVLRVNVLDPAMGSGHFLVEATEYIARFLVDEGIQPPLSPPMLGGPGGAEPQVDDLAAWKRRVVQSCIYGVDLNPLAVELAKLSLWLTTVARDRPLSFLDHHLRPGNSLVGANLADLQAALPGARKPRGKGRLAEAEAAGQTSMVSIPGFIQDMAHAVGNMWLIERSDAARVEDVKSQERMYDELRRHFLARHQRLADLATATRFGLEVDPGTWEPLARYAAEKSIAHFAQFDEILERAAAIAERERFFHWELEFPEIYFDEHGKRLDDDGGFEAVIGNPPYVRQEQLAPYKPYFAAAFQEVYQGTADLFVYFFAQAIRQARRGGRLSYISSNSWLRANYAGRLRALLRTGVTVESLVDVGDNRVFESAPDVYPAIHVVRKDPPPEEHVAQAAVFTRREGVADFAAQVAEKLQPVSMHDQPDSGWVLNGVAGRSLFDKLMGQGRPLGDVAGGRIYRGVSTGLNEALIVDRQTRDHLVAADAQSQDILKPVLRGEDLRPWYHEDDDLWLVFTRRGTDIEAYPAVKEHLAQYRERLEPRPPDWPNHERWPGRKPGSYKWYEIQDTVEYYQAFDQPKILWPDIAKYPRFSWDDSGCYLGNTGYVMVPDGPWLLGYLASRCAWFLISKTAISLGERAGMNRYRLIDQYMRPLPVPDAPAEEQEAIGGLAMAITEKARERYQVHRGARHRVLTDLGEPGKGLNQKLTAWWALDFPGFRAEVKKVFRRDIPVSERDEWEAWLAARRAEHERLTSSIIALETELNDRVYRLFGLTAEEIAVIEESTKYRYGEV